MTNLFLVDPPRAGLLEGASHGLASLADWVGCRAPQVRVTLLDWATLGYNQLEENATKVMSGCDRALVGITATTATYQAALAVARAFKEASPTAIVILGGHHATPEADLILTTHSEIDVVVRGEGERPMLDIVLGLPWQQISGISYRAHSTEIVTNPSAVPLSGLPDLLYQRDC